jgi:hypothetical protein
MRLWRSSCSGDGKQWRELVGVHKWLRATLSRGDGASKENFSRELQEMN